VKIVRRGADIVSMRSHLRLHRPGLFSLEPPRLGLQLAGFLGGLALAFFFGAAATHLLTGDLPRLAARLPWGSRDDVRWLALILGTASCFASVLMASGFGIKLFVVLSHRMGWPATLESEGPCRLVQDAPGLWGLRMDLSGGRTPDAPWPSEAGHVPPASCCLFFRLDEAAAGAVSHLTSPDEALVVRWLDLPLAVGGPALLEVRPPLREVVTSDTTVEVRRAA
jgi:hypothetical protein